MPRTPVRVFPSPDAIGEQVAHLVLARIDRARWADKRFVLGCPTGRTPRPIYRALARQLAEKPEDLSHVELVMMDEYLVAVGAGYEYVSARKPWSCHHYARNEIADRLNASLSATQRLREKSVWFPDPHDPAAYDKRIADTGGIDFCILASGASDGHVAFNPPGSALSSRTRIVRLSEDTRRDNLQTFPAFGTLAAVPDQGLALASTRLCRQRRAS